MYFFLLYFLLHHIIFHKCFRGSTLCLLVKKLTPQHTLNDSTLRNAQRNVERNTEINNCWGKNSK